MRKFAQGLIVGILLTILFLALSGAAQGVQQSITVYLNRINLQVKGRPVMTDNFLYNGITYVPLREVSEMLDKQVFYNSATATINITDKLVDSDYVLGDSAVNGVEIGMTKQELIEMHGMPDRVDPSVYGFTWYVYNDDYQSYVQAGIQNDRVVALFSNIGEWQLQDAIGIGTAQGAVNEKLGQPLPTITEGKYVYAVGQSTEYGLYDFSEQLYSYVFFDTHQNQSVTAVLLWSKEIPFKDIYWGSFHDFEVEKWQQAMEQQLFDLSNTIRLRMGYPVMVWDDQAAEAAYLHSCDMSANQFFDHINLKGEGPFDRIKAQGIRYVRAGENLAMGQINSIFAVQGLMNSEGHRKNLLGEYQRLGVGVCFNSGRKQTYYTQNFYTPLTVER